MALINCKECDKQISEHAIQCPHCGIKIKPKSNSSSLFIASILFIGFIWIVSDVLKTTSYENNLYKKPASDNVQDEQPPALPTANTWEYSSHLNSISNKSIYTATIQSQNDFKLSFPYNDGNVKASLQIRKHPEYGNEILFFVSQGQLHCSYSNCTINLRFDDGEVMSLAVNEPDDGSNTIYFLTKYKTVINKILKSKKLYIQATFFQDGSPTFEFNTENLQLDKLK